MKSKIIISKVFNPYYNLALEEYLISKEENVLYLWQNENTVVIGRNQNPYRECDIGQISKDEIYLARRKSGGGAVYHDLGNLNFTIISRKTKNLENTNIDDNFKFIISALKSIGIISSLSGRNDIIVNSKKISGSAFYEKNNIFCHHGTILIYLNIEKLDLYLKPSKLKLESKGIESVKSRVVNLSQVDDRISVGKVKNSLVDAYRKSYKEVNIEYIDSFYFEENIELINLVEFYSSWEWIYGESPKSNLSLEERFSWGIIQFEFNIRKGIIEDSYISTDSIINEKFNDLAKSLGGESFCKNSIKNKIKLILIDNKIKKDLLKYIDQLEI